jgi:hypothetical protein
MVTDSGPIEIHSLATVVAEMYGQGAGPAGPDSEMRKDSSTASGSTPMLPISPPETEGDLNLDVVVSPPQTHEGRRCSGLP